MACFLWASCCQKAPGCQQLISGAQHHRKGSSIAFAASLPRFLFPSPVVTHISCQQGAAYPRHAQLRGAGPAAVSVHTGTAGGFSHRGRRVRSTPDTKPGIWLRVPQKRDSEATV